MLLYVLIWENSPKYIKWLEVHTSPTIEVWIQTERFLIRYEKGKCTRPGKESQISIGDSLWSFLGILCITNGKKYKSYIISHNIYIRS